jgi:hypothetical protein
MLHARTKIRFRFDDPNLLGHADLVPVMALAGRCGLDRLVGRLLTVPGSAGANGGLKVQAIVAGMVAGADSVFGYAKQGASYGYTTVKGPHPLLAVRARTRAARSATWDLCGHYFGWRSGRAFADLL